MPPSATPKLVPVTKKGSPPLGESEFRDVPSVAFGGAPGGFTEIDVMEGAAYDSVRPPGVSDTFWLPTDSHSGRLAPAPGPPAHVICVGVTATMLHTNSAELPYTTARLRGPATAPPAGGPNSAPEMTTCVPPVVARPAQRSRGERRGERGGGH